MPQVTPGKPAKTSRPRPSERVSFTSGRARARGRRGGRRDQLACARRYDRPDGASPGHRLTHTTVVIDSAILVFREGLETILVLAAVTASFLGGNRIYRRPVAARRRGRDRGGGGHVAVRGVAHRPFPRRRVRRAGGDRAAVADRAADRDELVLPQGLLDRLDLQSPQAPARSSVGRSGHQRRRMLLGLALLGFTSVYRECFEVVIFLQTLRELYGSSVVLEGVVSAACSPPPPASSRSRCTRGCRTGGC